MKSGTVWLITAVLAAGTAAQAQFGGLGDRDNDRSKPGPDFIVIRVRGRVESMTGSDRFVLTSKGMRFRVDYRPKDKRVNLREGDQVHVSGALSERDLITADELDVTERGRGGPAQSRILSGRIRTLNRTTQRFTVETSGGVVTVGWNNDTEWVRNRGNATATDFRTGEPVRIIGFEGQEKVWRARRVIFGGRAGFETGSVGEIVSLDGRAQEIEVDFEGEVWTVRLKGATLRRGQRRVELDDLRVGQDVRISGTSRGSRSVEATTVEVLRDQSPNRN